MAKLEEKGILGIKGIIFDLYNTLIDIHTDEESINTYEAVSKWLIYQGVKIPAEDLKNDYRRMAKEGMEAKWEKHPEIRVEDIFGRICKSHALRDIDEVRLGVETARAFRAGSLRRLQLFPQSLHIIAGAEKLPQGHCLQRPEVVLGAGDEIFRPLRAVHSCDFLLRLRP